MSALENRAVVEKWYEALAKGDFEALAAMHPENVVFNIIGSTPISGRFVGRNVVFGDIVPRVVASLERETIQFGKKWRIMAADDNCVVGLMQGGGIGKNGEAYAQTYCQIFSFQDNRIVEVYEFFDTVLAERVLFGNHLEKAEAIPENPLRF